MELTPTKLSSATPSSEAKILVPLFLIGIVALGTISGLLIRVRGGFAYPPYFPLFHFLFELQQGLFACAILALLFYIFARLRVPIFVQVAGYVLFYFWFLWIVLWGWVQHSYGIELTPQAASELFIHWHSVAEVGFVGHEFLYFLLIVLVIWVALVALSLLLIRRSGATSRKASFVTVVPLFVVVHLIVRSYFVHEINRNEPVVLAYDDRAPIPLRSEKLIPGLRKTRWTIPNLESAARTEAYLQAAKQLPSSPIPAPRDILWIILESFRFDAITPQAMSRLSSYQEQFQIKLQRNHWSGGNATHFGIFSMLTGLSGEHYADFRKSQITTPLLRLLSLDGYRLRCGKKSYFEFGGLSDLLPPETELVDCGDGTVESDRRMVDKYLADISQQSDERHRCDLLSFDATHWPYFFPQEDALFQPAPELKTSLHVLRSSEDIESIRNRYRNACHFIDTQIGRILDDLQQRGRLANTIVIIVGDHGEEFQERGQITHSAVLNDFQGRTALWMHLPNLPSAPLQIDTPTVHLDIVPTLLQALGFNSDILYTQGQSLLEQMEPRPVLSLCEQGFNVPLYRALVTDTYISRWLDAPGQYLFSGIQRRDGTSVSGDAWRGEVQSHLDEAAQMYEIFPDTSPAPRTFRMK